MYASREHFSSKREKAQKIHDWFSNNSSHNYADYRGALDRKSNIVEFEDVKKLFDKKNFTVSSIEAVL
jgi:hypothetical protein